MDSKKTKYRGKFKFSLCKWLRMPTKTYIIEGNDDSDDSDDDDDWDTGDFINGNKQVQRICRRQGMLSIFKPVGS
jgi:hypothetical protein